MKGRWPVVTVLAAAVAGLVVLQAVFPDRSWTLRAQLGLVWLVLASLTPVLVARAPEQDRPRLWLVFAPALVLIGLGVLVPDWALFFAGGGLGWIVAAHVLLRGRTQMGYRLAIRHLRRGEYAEALAAMQSLVEAEPKDPAHRCFRAELYRLAGDLDHAAGEYRQAVRLAPDSAAGYAGLAEVFAQQGRFDEALPLARQAYECDPNQWTAAYTLGLILDRLGQAAEAVHWLEQAQSAGIPHGRYRLLTHLWLARNHARLGEQEASRAQVKALRKQSRGLEEWQTILSSEQAAPLRALLAQDVALAQRLCDEPLEDGNLDNLEVL